jgi:putative effector of murein hydrolase
MHMRNAILVSTLIAFVAALGYGLRQLSQSMEVGPFLLFCIATFAFMVACGFAYDHYAAYRDRSSCR